MRREDRLLLQFRRGRAQVRADSRHWSRDPVDDPWACPRPDKRHHGSEQRCRERLAEQPDPDRDVWDCPCGRGWVWGRL